MTLLTPAEVASELGVSERTLRQWRSDQRGPAYVKDGGVVRYLEEDLDAWARRQRVVPVRSDARVLRAVR